MKDNWIDLVLSRLYYIQEEKNNVGQLELSGKDARCETEVDKVSYGWEKCRNTLF